MNTMAVAAEEATEAPELATSLVDDVTVVPSDCAWVLMASRGAMRY